MSPAPGSPSAAPTSATVLLGLLLLLVAPAVAQPPDPPGLREPPATPATDHAALRVEEDVARMLVRLDEDLELESFPDGSPEWPARLAASIEAREADAPGQALLRGLAVALRRMGVDHPLGPRPFEVHGARPSVVEHVGRERAETIVRIRERIELVNRKLGIGPGSRSNGTRARSAHRPAASSSTLTSLEPRSHQNGSDSCSNAAAVAEGIYTGYTTYASNDGNASCGGTTPTPDHWFRFTAPSDGTYSFATLPVTYGQFDTVLSLHTGCPVSGNDRELTCSDDAGGSLLSSISYPLEAAQEIWIRVSGYDGATGDYRLAIGEARTVSGTVIRETDGVPLEGVSVEVTDDYADLQFRAQTRADGSYEVGMSRTSRSLYAEARQDGFVTELFDDYECSFGVYCNRYSGDPISIDAADATQVDFTLLPAGTITGTVTATDTGEPLSASSYVYLYREDGSYVGSVKAAADGSYELAALPAGDYRLVSSGSGYWAEVWNDVPCNSPCDERSGSVVTVGAGSTVSGIDFVLDRLAVVRGTVVRTDTAEPIPGLLVDLYDDNGTWMASDYTDASGVYEIGQRLPGDYFVRTSSGLYRNELFDEISCEPGCSVLAGTVVSTELNTDTLGIDFSLDAKAAISGAVTDAATGEPIDVRVYLHDGDGEILDHQRLYDWYASPVYTFEGLDAGTYYVRTGYEPSAHDTTHEAELYDAIPCPSGCDATTGTPVVAGTTSQITGIDFQLRRRGRISGTVTSQSSGTLVRNGDVSAYNLDGSVARSFSLYFAGGNYTISGLSAGDYRVGTDTTAYVDEMYDDVPCGEPCDRTTGALVTVRTDQETSAIDFALRSLGRISGRGYDASSGAAIDTYAQLFDSAGSVVASTVGSPDFVFIGLDPGTYYLAARDYGSSTGYQDEVYLDLPCDPECDVTQGMPLEVAIDTPLTGIDFYLARCPAASWSEVISMTIDGYYKALACDRVTASETTLTSGADVTFRSGRSVVLGNGFRMAPGAKLQVIIEPDWADE